MIVDTHCHLDFGQFDNDRPSVVQRARECNVSGFILIGIDPSSWQATRDVTAEYRHMWRTAGLHPNSVADHWTAELESQLRNEVAGGELVGIGETGVDLYRSGSSRSKQMEAFDVHIQIAKDAGLPVVIHQRNAEVEVLEVLSNHGEVRGVMHCFGGDTSFAEQCLTLGLHLGIGGVATYPSAGATRDAIANAPADRLLLETDAPFLAPQPQRGKRNEPSYLVHVVETIAACRGESPEHVEEVTTRNAVALFNLEV